MRHEIWVKKKARGGDFPACMLFTVKWFMSQGAKAVNIGSAGTQVSAGYHPDDSELR
jgi:hypothetical protein